VDRAAVPRNSPGARTAERAMTRPLTGGRQPLTRWAVPVLFAVAAASTGAHTFGSIDHALSQASTRAWLVALYGVLRTSVALAFAVFTVGRAAPQRPSRNPVAFVA